jgi:hypothetical protein
LVLQTADWRNQGLVDSLPCTPKGKVSICPSNIYPLSGRTDWSTL